MLYANEWDIEGIITSSSQYHWQGHNWAGDNWIDPDLDAYEKVYSNLLKHDPGYPTPEYLRSITLLGNVKAEGEMEEVTAGSMLIVDVLLDETDNRPVWLQAWGGVNTIARALKTIQEEHPEKMEYVANKIRLFLIWEQDVTYQDYIKPNWGKYNILTIISDQFISYFYNLNIRWWQYTEADTYKGSVEIKSSTKKNASFKVPNDANSENTIHIICEVTDSGTPQLTRYQRVVVKIH